MWNRESWNVAAAVICIAFLAGACSAPKAQLTLESLNAADAVLVLTQNSSASLDLQSGLANEIEITQAPAHGAVTVDHTSARYWATDPLYSGTDSFKYKLKLSTLSSNEATVNVTLTPLTSGTTTYSENYAGGAFALTGWNSFTSSFGHSINSVVSFATSTFNSAAADSRHFGVYGDNSAYGGNSLYTALFGALPVDGAGGAMKDWAWKADLVYLPECGVDATVTVKAHENIGQAIMMGILLNYSIEENSQGEQELTGYQVLVNGGGGSLTLSRFNGANERALAFMDRWPNTNFGTEGNANPVQLGPYKGWNYLNGAFPAGGQLQPGPDALIAVRYQYDTATGNTTISYELRQIDGTDNTPGTWDVVVNLTGADSLRTGGGFGLMPVGYHTSASVQNTDFDVTEFKAQCVLP